MLFAADLTVITVGKKTLPAPLQKAGCYSHTTNSTSWTAVPCLSKDALALIPKPIGNPGLYESGNTGSFVAPVNAELDVHILQIGSVSDSKQGRAQFTLQLNSNPHPGANGNQYWTQFVQTNDLSGGQQQSVLCTWNINLTTQDYGLTDGDTQCVLTSDAWGPLPGDTASLVAYASGGNLTLAAVLPWAITTPDAYSVVTPDVYGLEASRTWYSIDGGMLGAGNGSIATFTKSCVSTTLTALFNAVPVNAYVGPGVITLETNNLQSVNTPFGMCAPQGAEGVFNYSSCTATFDQVSSDYTQGQKACYPGDTPVPPLPPGQSQGAFEDDGTNMTFAGTNAHVCPGGALLIGVDAQNNRFLCSNAFLLPQPATTDLTVDTATHQTFTVGGNNVSVHVCPTTSAMIGWNQDKDWLICRTLNISGFVPVSGQNFGAVTVDGPPGAQVPEPSHGGVNMHSCDTKGNGGPLAMFGIQASLNAFICINSEITPRLN
jgi:hypothetical protein